MVLVLILVIGASRKRLIPGRFQGFVELIIESLLNFVEGVAGREMAASEIWAKSNPGNVGWGEATNWNPLNPSIVARFRLVEYPAAFPKTT